MAEEFVFSAFFSWSYYVSGYYYWHMGKQNGEALSYLFLIIVTFFDIDGVITPQAANVRYLDN